MAVFVSSSVTTAVVTVVADVVVATGVVLACVVGTSDATDVDPEDDLEADVFDACVVPPGVALAEVVTVVVVAPDDV